MTDKFKPVKDEPSFVEEKPPTIPPPPTVPEGLDAILVTGRVVPVESSRPTTVDDGMRTPESWASDLKVPAWLHAMARQLHGWHEHEHHAGAPMRMSKAAYIDALAAANTTDPKRHGKPSLNAKSPHHGKGL